MYVKLLHGTAAVLSSALAALAGVLLLYGSSLMPSDLEVEARLKAISETEAIDEVMLAVDAHWRQAGRLSGRAPSGPPVTAQFARPCLFGEAAYPRGGGLPLTACVGAWRLFGHDPRGALPATGASAAPVCTTIKACKQPR